MTPEVQWQQRVIIKASALGLLGEPGVAAEGAGVVVQDATAPWVHKGPAVAILSQGLGKMFPGVLVRWVGWRTLRVQSEATQWFASIEAALEAVCSRYASEEAVWRLGG